MEANSGCAFYNMSATDLCVVKILITGRHYLHGGMGCLVLTVYDRSVCVNDPQYGSSLSTGGYGVLCVHCV